MLSRAFIPMSVLCGFVSSASAAPAMLRIAQDESEPYIIKKGFPIAAGTIGKCKYTTHVGKGIDIDIAEEAVRRAGFTPKVDIMPWSRVKLLMRGDKLDLIPGLVYGEENGKPRYKYVNYDAGGATVFYRRKGTAFEVTRPEDFKTLRLGTVREDSYGALFDAEAKKGNIVTREEELATDVKQNFEKLLASRVDVIAVNNVVGAWHVRRNNLDDKVEALGFRFDYVNEPDKDAIYLAFNRKVPDDVVEKVKAVVEEMKKDGSLACISQKYLSVMGNN